MKDFALGFGKNWVSTEQPIRIPAAESSQWLLATLPAGQGLLRKMLESTPQGSDWLPWRIILRGRGLIGAPWERGARCLGELMRGGRRGSVRGTWIGGRTPRGGGERRRAAWIGAIILNEAGERRETAHIGPIALNGAGSGFMGTWVITACLDGAGGSQRCLRLEGNRD